MDIAIQAGFLQPAPECLQQRAAFYDIFPVVQNWYFLQCVCVQSEMQIIKCD